MNSIRVKDAQIKVNNTRKIKAFFTLLKKLKANQSVKANHEEIKEWIEVGRE